MSNRPAIPEKLKQQVLYKSSFCCVICQGKVDHLHHIDKNNRNNQVSNLVALCTHHHDEAHTNRELSQNLSANRIKKFRDRWYEEVSARRLVASSVSCQKDRFKDDVFGTFASWGYINHSRVIEFAGSSWKSHVDSTLIKRCISGNLIDERGILVRPSAYTPTGSYVSNTVYDWFEFGDNHAVHLLYSELVDHLVKKHSPVHLSEAAWTRRFIGAAINSGDFIVLDKATYFKRVDESEQNCAYQCSHIQTPN